MKLLCLLAPICAPLYYPVCNTCAVVHQHPNSVQNHMAWPEDLFAISAISHLKVRKISSCGKNISAKKNTMLIRIEMKSFFIDIAECFAAWITCSWHVFTNSESTNPRIFFRVFFWFSIETKNVAKTVYIFLQKKTFLQLLKKKTRHFSWKKIVDYLVDSEFVKICHEQVRNCRFEICIELHWKFVTWKAIPVYLPTLAHYEIDLCNDLILTLYLDLIIYTYTIVFVSQSGYWISTLGGGGNIS